MAEARDFEPELGQAIFSGPPWGEVEMEPHVKAGISLLTSVVADGNWEKDASSNVGGGGQFNNGTFELHAYCWCDNSLEGHEDGCPPNFKCGDFEARWYKYLGRGSSQNRAISVSDWRTVVMACLASLGETP